LLVFCRGVAIIGPCRWLSVPWLSSVLWMPRPRLLRSIPFVSFSVDLFPPPSLFRQHSFPSLSHPFECLRKTAVRTQLPPISWQRLCRIAVRTLVKWVTTVLGKTRLPRASPSPPADTGPHFGAIIQCPRWGQMIHICLTSAGLEQLSNPCTGVRVLIFACNLQVWSNCPIPALRSDD